MTATLTARQNVAEAPKRVFAYLLLAVALAAFIGALEVAYAAFMAPRFGYLGYTYQEPDRLWMLAAYLLLLAGTAALPYKPNRISGFAAWFLYAALLVPIATVPLYGSSRPPEDTFMFAVFCTVVWTLVAMTLRAPAPSLIPTKTTGARLFWASIITISAATYIYLNAVFGITFNLLSVFEIYETRLQYRDELVPTVPLLGYLITNQGNVINPLLMATGAHRRRLPLIALGIIGQLVLYSTTGYKTVLISIPICIGLAFLLKKRHAFPGISIMLGATILVWASITIDRIASLGLVDIIVSRVFLTAGYLMPLYRNVYDGNPPALWDYSFLGPLVDAPYDRTPGFHVAETMLNRPDIQLNASLFADGYANLGLAGIAIEAAALVIILKLIDSSARGLPLAILIPTATLPIFSLANGSPFTALLSYGFLLMGTLFALMPREPTPATIRNSPKRRQPLWP